MLHFDQLGAAVVLVNWDGLPTERDPKAVEYKDESYDKYIGKWNIVPDVWNAKDDYLAGLDLSHEEEYLYECLLDAEVGFKTHLVTLMAESVYPENPQQAKRFINRERITPQAVRAAIDMLGQTDTDDILATLFDAAYIE